MKPISVPPYEDIESLRESFVEQKSMVSAPLMVNVSDGPASIKCVAPQVSALDELMAMTGLENVKERIIGQLHYHRIMGIRKAAGKYVPPRMMHMLFTGNPGTGKTTVARLLGRIYKDAGLLSGGQLVEATRARIVGRYIGDTECKMSELINKARGGVLFIDEAYSLFEDNDGAQSRDFGTKAIDTLLPELTESSDMVVIFAGYSSSMQKALATNPGLRSRFPLTLHFDDYTAGQLSALALDELKKQELILSREAHAKLEHLIGEAVKVPDFGNARFVRTLIYNHILPRQCNRLITSGAEIDVEKTSQIEVGDIPPLGILFPYRAVKCRKVGFCY